MMAERSVFPELPEPIIPFKTYYLALHTGPVPDKSNQVGESAPVVFGREGVLITPSTFDITIIGVVELGEQA